jgi:cephalosporin hydroxylase
VKNPFQGIDDHDIGTGTGSARRAMSNPLEDWFNANHGALMNKWMHYFDIYDRHFSRFRGRDIVVVEIGVYHGGSLGMWKSYFGANAKLVGVDINPRARKFADTQVDIVIGDQSDRVFLRDLRARYPHIDVLLDDGGHAMHHQITTFEELFDAVAEDGVYMVEDTHTSYWPEFGGGLHSPVSFIEYAKRLADQLNAWHVREWADAERSAFARSAWSLTFYDSIVAIEKRPKKPPEPRLTGKLSFLALDE